MKERLQRKLKNRVRVNWLSTRSGKKLPLRASALSRRRSEEKSVQSKCIGFGQSTLGNNVPVLENGRDVWSTHIETGWLAGVVLLEVEERPALLTEHEFHSSVHGCMNCTYMEHFLGSRLTCLLILCNIFARFLFLVSYFYLCIYFFVS